MKERGSNKAKRDKNSILVDVKMLLKLYHPIYQRMPKIERVDGCAKEFKDACYSLIRHFCIAYYCQEVRSENIRKMIGDYGVMMATFDLVRAFRIATNQDLYLMAEKMERIEESVGKWRSATRHTLAST